MIIYILEIFLVIWFFCLLLFALLPIHLNKNTIIRFWMIGILLLAVLAFYTSPTSDMDLYRSYKDIDAFRNGSMKIFDSPFIILNFIYWLVSRTSYNGWYAFLSVLGWGLCIRQILKEYLTNENYTTRYIMLYFMAAFGGVYVVYIISGNRSPFATALWAYAYLKWYDNNKIRFYLIMSLTVFIHLIGIILIGFTFIYELLNSKNSILLYGLILFIVLAVGYMLSANITLKSLEMIVRDIFKENMYIVNSFRTWDAYSIRTYDYQIKNELLFRILTSIYLFICTLKLYFNNQKKWGMISFLVLIMYAGFNISILFERIPYALGVISLPVINETMRGSKKVTKIALFVLGFVVFGGQMLWGVYETFTWLKFTV